MAAGHDVPESLAVGRALQAMKRSEIVVLVIDAEEGASQQDFVLAERAALTVGPRGYSSPCHGCHSTDETRVQIVMDDVASSAC